MATPHSTREGRGLVTSFYSSLLRCSVQCGTNHSAVFRHMSVAMTTSVGNYKCETTVKPRAAAVFCEIVISLIVLVQWSNMKFK